MERYWDCSLCRIENKAEAFRCRSCSGKLRGRDRLLFELSGRLKVRRIATVLSACAAGLGQIYARRWLTGLALAVLLPLAVGLVAATWDGFTYGHFSIAAVAVFVLVLAGLDAYLGPARKLSPCQRACPAGLDIPDYLQLCEDGEFDQGHALIRTRIPLVGVIGRVCPHPCETQCVRGIDGEPIAINGCKRFLADKHREQEEQRPRFGSPQVILGRSATSVGVVGSGPAGLACAYYLSVLGVTVTVYERDALIGGRLATTIPDYRLPPFILNEEVEVLKDMGIAFALETPVGEADGPSVAGLLSKHAALFLSVGAQTSLQLSIPGVEALDDFQDYLRQVKRGSMGGTGRRVAVIGGGNAAMDVCRSALRAGAEEVHLIYRRTRDEMPARPDEVEEAEREGVELHFLADPVRLDVIPGQPHVLTLRTMRLGAPDASGRPRPVPLDGKDWQLEVEQVIPALGQSVGGEVLDDPTLRGVNREADGRLHVDPRTQRTSLARIYAGGDAVSGPATAVEAMAAGRRAALSIYGTLLPVNVPYLRLRDRRLRHPFRGHQETPQARIREEMPKLSLRVRTETFREVEEGLRDASARRESARCLQCHREL